MGHEPDMPAVVVLRPLLGQSGKHVLPANVSEFDSDRSCLLGISAVQPTIFLPLGCQLFLLY